MKSTQRYISGELTHFVGSKLIGNEYKQYCKLKKILCDKKLFPSGNPRFKSGWTFDSSKKISDNEMFTSLCVSFSDIPVGDLDIHIKKYGKCGLSFTKYFIAEQGGRPVQYIPYSGCNLEGELNNEYFDRLSSQAYSRIMPLFRTNKDLQKKIPNLPEIGDFLILEFAPYLKFYDHNLDDSNDKNYYFEREWRVMGQVKFSIEDVERIFIPKKYAVRLREDFPKFYGQVTFT